MLRTQTTLSILVVFCTCILTTSFAQTTDEQKARIGLMLNGAITLHSADFTQLPTIPNCCPGFTGGSGSGLFLGLTYIEPLSKEVNLNIRLHYGSYNSAMTASESKPIISSTGAEIQSTISHNLDASFQQISIEPLLGYKVAPSVNLLGGITAGYILSGTFSQKEVLESPTDVTFAGNVRQRNVITDADIPELNQIAVGLTVGASFDLALNSSKSVFLSPEVLFTFNPLAVVNGLSWSAHQLRAGLVVSFVPPEVEDSLNDVALLEFARRIEPPTRVTPGIAFISEVSAVGVNDAGQTQDLRAVRIEEFASTRLRPILPYVFFEANSTDVPERYHRISESATESFSMNNFFNLDAMVTYRHLLNIVGKRMQENPSSSITLTGTSDPSENTTDGLAEKRAASVKNYLTDTWGIDASRIKTEARGLPQNPSNSSEADGRAENQRVEISSSDAALLAPVTSQDTMRVFQPSGIRFSPRVNPKAPVNSWTLYVTNNDRIIRTFHNTDPIPAQVDWRVSDQFQSIAKGSSDLEYLLVVRDTLGQVIPSETHSIKVDEVTLDSKKSSNAGDKTIDRYSMILFGFDKSDLTPENRTIANEVKSKISPSSTVKVVGYTDRSGSEEYNKRLSEQRARSVAQAIGVSESAASGNGELFPLYDNNTPEGRFYSRTVEVLVDTPRK